MEMLSLHFNKQVFINALKANKNMVTYLSTTVALMLTLLFHGLIQGHLKAEYFAYALFVSAAFYSWAIIDQKYRSQKKSKQTD
jgi:cytochrome c oxidase assembly factor CtaG